MARNVEGIFFFDYKLNNIIHITFIGCKSYNLRMVMQKGIVKIEDNDLKVGTWDLSKGFQIEHRSIKNIIEKHKSDFEEFGTIKKDGYEENIHCTQNAMNPDGTYCIKHTKSRTSKMGRPVEQYIINEEQYVFLGTLLPNSEHVVKFKKKLTKEFFRMRKVLIKLAIQKENEDWQAKRAAGLIERRLETDAIKDFIEYATEQGSKSAKMYYVNITKMENNSLLSIELLNQKFENMRDVVDGFDLTSLQMADKIVAQALREGMKNQMHYKDIYESARDRVEAFALVIGRTPLRLINSKIKPVTLTFARDRILVDNK